jgi:hypothetical protein
MNFPTNLGFTYDEDNNEWFKHFSDGRFIIFSCIRNISLWRLSFEDKDDYLFEIMSGFEQNIIDEFKLINRDYKLSQILGE